MEKKIIKKQDQGNGQWILNNFQRMREDGSLCLLCVPAFSAGQRRLGLVCRRVWHETGTENLQPAEGCEG